MPIVNAKFLFLAFFLVSLLLLDIVAADKCNKKILREVFFERCRMRSKRNDHFTNMQSRDHRAIKRQIMSIREIFVASRVPFYPVPYPSHARHQYMPPVVPPSSVYRLQRPKAVSLPQESHSEVGFEMSYEEMMELLDEFYERLPRGAKSRDEVQNEYMPLFEECCKNIDVCRMKKARDCPYI